MLINRTTMQETRTIINTITKDLSDVKVIQARHRKKGWGEGPIDFLGKAAAVQTAVCQDTFDMWMDIKAMKVEELTLQELQQHYEALKTANSNMETGFKAFSKDMLADFVELK